MEGVFLKMVNLITYSSFALFFVVFFSLFFSLFFFSSFSTLFLFSLIFSPYTGISAIRVAMEERKKDLVLALELYTVPSR
jgi:ABC-type multidrug transport system permease subunit